MASRVKRYVLIAALGCAPLNANTTKEVQEHQDWLSLVASDNESTIAATINDSGAVLRAICDVESSKCFWQIRAGAKCSTGSSSPVLVNTSNSAISTTIICDGETDGLYGYTISDFDAMTDIVAKSVKIGFAIPLEGDKFTVFRFSLRGAKDALLRAYDLIKEKNKTSTKNQTI